MCLGGVEILGVIHRLKKHYINVLSFLAFSSFTDLSCFQKLKTVLFQSEVQQVNLELRGSVRERYCC